MAKDAITRHELDITARIMKDPDRSKKLWDNINMLKNGKKEKPKIISIYKGNGEILDKVDIPNELKTGWEKIYQKHENTIGNIWNAETKLQYEGKLEIEKNNILNVHNGQTIILIEDSLREHYDMTLTINDEKASPMTNQEITISDIDKQLKKIMEKLQEQMA